MFYSLTNCDDDGLKFKKRKHTHTHRKKEAMYADLTICYSRSGSISWVQLLITSKMKPVAEKNLEAANSYTYRGQQKHNGLMGMCQTGAFLNI